MQFSYINKTLTSDHVVQLVLRVLLFLMLVIALPVHATQKIVATRVWPAEDYTRITLESDQEFSYTMLEIGNPDRIVLDLENVEIDQNLKAVLGKVLPNDPFINNIRLGNFKSNVVRLVVDLKTQAKPKVFSLLPAGNYKHRLVLDLYPIKDSLMTMLDERQIKPVAPKVKPAVAKATKPTVVAKSKTHKPNRKNPSSSGRIKRKIVIAIDAGHGGEDPGASGATGSREKDVTLSIAKRLKAEIDKEPNMRGELVRNGDYFIPLRGRVLKSRKMQADLFVSIHADAFTKESASGSSVYVLSQKGATSASAKFLAQKENESDLIGGVSLLDKDPVLADILLDLSQTAMINDSLIVAKAVLGQIGKINKLHKKQVEQANFVVLRSPDTPSILIETAFISNKAEEEKLKSTRYQHKLAKSILVGIKKYFAGNPALAHIPAPDAYAKK
jgi:N-acetylmuramoyl-L-alanine amidase